MRVSPFLVATILAGSTLVGSAPRGAAAKGAFAADRQAARAACMEDAKSLCSNVTPGDGHIMQCIRSHEDRVSRPCRDALDKLHEDRKQDRTNAS